MPANADKLGRCVTDFETSADKYDEEAPKRAPAGIADLPR
jgi:hypothetical protein